MVSRELLDCYSNFIGLYVIAEWIVMFWVICRFKVEKSPSPSNFSDILDAFFPSIFFHPPDKSLIT